MTIAATFAEEEKRERARGYRRKWHEKLSPQALENKRARAREYQRQRRLSDPEKVRAILKKSYDKHAEKRRLSSKVWKDKNRERAKANRHKAQISANYGLTTEEYESMSAGQGHRCAICSGINKSGRKLAVDHCHKTGKVRQLLCSKCNTSLGGFGDSIEMLQKAIDYLGKHQ